MENNINPNNLNNIGLNDRISLNSIFKEGSFLPSFLNLFFWCLTITIFTIKLWEFKSMWVFGEVIIIEPNKIILFLEILVLFCGLVWAIKMLIKFILRTFNPLE